MVRFEVVLQSAYDMAASFAVKGTACQMSAAPIAPGLGAHQGILVRLKRRLTSALEGTRGAGS